MGRIRPAAITLVISSFFTTVADGQEVQSVVVVGEDDVGVKSAISVVNTVTRKSRGDTLYTDDAGVLGNRRIKCLKDERISADPINPVYSEEGRTKKCEKNVKIVVSLSNVALAFYLEGKELSSRNDKRGAAVAFAEAAKRSRGFPSLSSNAEYLTLANVGAELGHPDSVVFNGGWNFDSKGKIALQDYQAKYGIPATGTFDDATQKYWIGYDKSLLVGKAYTLSSSLGLLAPGTYQIFFDSGKDQVPDFWKDVLYYIAKESSGSNVKEILISGFADPGEAKDFDGPLDALSLKRALAIRDALIKAGASPTILKAGTGIQTDGPLDVMRTGNLRAEVKIITQ